MTTTVDVLRGDLAASDLFYYVKITGINYYFFSVFSPMSAAYGTSAWTLPSGYVAVQGLDLPSDSLQQTASDIIGGIASGERIRVSLRDFDVSDSHGVHPYLSFLFAPGRVTALGTSGQLESSIGAGDTAGATFDVMGLSTAISSSSTVHVGAEAIGIGSVGSLDGDGRQELTIASRNLFPCNANFPPTPYHRVALTAADTGVLNANPVVSPEPITLIGRTAAFYIGHLLPDGTPCAEVDTLCRLIGRITSVDYGSIGGQYELEIESITGELDKAQVAPGLARATIQSNQIAFPAKVTGSPNLWRTLIVGYTITNSSTNAVTSEDAAYVTIGSSTDPVTFTPDELLEEVNSKLSAVHFALFGGGRFTPKLELVTTGGEKRFQFSFLATVTSSQTTVFRVSAAAVGCGLVYALGFASDVNETTADTSVATAGANGATALIVADGPAPSVFIPAVHSTGVSVVTAGDDTGPFFSLQGEGSGGWVRLGDGKVVKLLNGTSPQSIGERIPSEIASILVSTSGAFLTATERFYSVPTGSAATMEQVLVQPGDTSDSSFSAATLIGRLLCSKGSLFDTEYNVFPEGVGVGWNDIVDKDSIRRLTDAGTNRLAFIDSSTKFSDLFKPMSRENGWLLVWDPETSQVAIRPIRVPNSSLASSIVLSESNRTSVDDRTSQRIDQTSLRTSWTIKWGYSRVDDKFLGSDLTVNDNWVLSAYQSGAKPEIIEDKTLALGSNNSAVTLMASILSRGYFYRQPWVRCKRTLTKEGLTLAPGSYHKIVDNTIVNPFTGMVGVTAADRLYCMLIGVTGDPGTGMCTAEFLINRQDPASNFRGYSVSALVDFSASTHGYNSTTGVITVKTRYASDQTKKDAIDFIVGDVVNLVSRDNDGAPAYLVTTTVTSVATDGSTMTVATGLAAFPIDVEMLVVLQDYSTQGADRKADLAFQGAVNGTIEGTGDKDHRWQ